MRLLPIRRDDHSGVLIGASGTRRSDWPVRALANDVMVSTIIDRMPAHEERSIARVQEQVAANCYSFPTTIPKVDCRLRPLRNLYHTAQVEPEGLHFLQSPILESSVG